VISVVVVVHDMARELPRTLRSLSPSYQHGLTADDYEVIVVDNGSPEPVDPALLVSFDGRLRLERIDPAPPSPARAANRGLQLAEGNLVGIVVDGARLASPGLLAEARRATCLAPRPVITAPAFHLGPVRHMQAAEAGYDQAAEDRLLAESGWEDDAYRLFEVSTPAGSWGRGLFGPAGESSSLFCPRSLWDELGGLDERFTLPGGGLVNHDLYRRACALEGAVLLVLLGEATFHQYHGGAATARRYSWEEMHAEYQAVTGVPHRPPANPPMYVGPVRPAMLPLIERSARQAINRLAAHGK
jgi:glycosyltransferase involved in cell wall biosynthesis